MIWPFKPSSDGGPAGFNTEFIVDISKPPIFPPCRTIKCGIGGDYETKESKQRTEAWERYIKKYGEALENKK